MAGVGFSGKDGDVKIGATQAQEARHWTFKPKADNKSYASNKTAGYKRRVAGVKEASGTVAGAWDAANPITTLMDVGSGVTLLLFLNATINFSVPSLIDDLTVNVDIDNGEIVSWDANFGSNGAWTNAPSGMTAEPETAMTADVPPEEPKPPLLTTEQVQAMIEKAVAGAMAAMMNMSVHQQGRTPESSGDQKIPDDSEAVAATGDDTSLTAAG